MGEKCLKLTFGIFPTILPPDVSSTIWANISPDISLNLTPNLLPYLSKANNNSWPFETVDVPLTFYSIFEESKNRTKPIDSRGNNFGAGTCSGDAIAGWMEREGVKELLPAAIPVNLWVPYSLC